MFLLSGAEGETSESDGTSEEGGSQEEEEEEEEYDGMMMNGNGMGMGGIEEELKRLADEDKALTLVARRNTGE